jgi:hypothetical protein
MQNYPTQRVLELACAAQRHNKDYIKEPITMYAADGKALYTAVPNRDLMIQSLVAGSLIKAPLYVTDADKELATDIRKYFRKLIFAAVKNEDDFYTQLNAILINPDIPHNRLGFVACLPSTYQRDYAKTQFEKRINDLTHEYIGLIGEQILDRDCDIIEVKRSKNYDAWNISAIIENKLTSWMGKEELKLGPCVIIKAKVKEHSSHWKYQVPETRMNYVKAFQ